MFERRTNTLKPPASSADAIAVASISLLLHLAGATAVAGAVLPAVAGAAAPVEGSDYRPQYALMLVKNANFKVR